MKKTNVISFKNFKSIVGESLSLYTKTWWRVLCLNVITLSLIALTMVIFGTIGFAILESTGESFENMFNPETGIRSEYTGLIFSFIGLFVLVTILFSILGKSAIVLMIKRIESKKKQKKTTLFKLYFKEAPKFFWRFFMNGLRIFWYVLWPLLAIAGIGGLLFWGSTFIPSSAPQIEGMNIVSIAIIFIGSITGICILIKRSIKSAFTQNTLLIKDISSKDSFEKSLQMAKGKVWKLIVFFAGIGFIGAVITSLLGLIPVYNGIEIGEIFIQIIVPPFAITCYYLLTNMLLKQK